MIEWSEYLKMLPFAERAVNFAASMKSLNIFPSLKSTKVGLTKMTPVIYAGTVGEGGEYHAADDPDKPAPHILDVPNLPPKAKIIAAWYTPYHNVAGIIGFALIDVEKHNDRQVILNVGAYKGVQTRARIVIHVLYSE
jgi:hypothetical protein